MNPTKILSGWIIVQLIVIGLIGGVQMNDRLNCVPDSKLEAYEDSFGYNVIATALPLVVFVPSDWDEMPVEGCPDAPIEERFTITATSTGAGGGMGTAKQTVCVRDWGYGFVEVECD